MSKVTASAPTSIDAPQFADDFSTAFQRLRAALTDLMAATGADATRPQEVSRQFGLHRNLSWKISKIIGSYNGYECVRHIPGQAGFSIFLAAMTEHGAPPASIESVRVASRAFDKMVKTHAGSRATLEQMVGHAQSELGPSEHLEASRKLAFQGNSGTWGAQASVQFAFDMLAPNADDPAWADLVQVGGLVGFRRLRPDVRWLLFRRQSWDDTGPQAPCDAPLVGGDRSTTALPVLDAFSSPPHLAIEVVEAHDEIQYVLPNGPVGHSASMTCVYGLLGRPAGPTHAAEGSPHLDLGCTLTTPAERFQFDLMVHEDLPWATDVTALLFSRLDGASVLPTAERERNHLPFCERVHTLGRGLAPLATTDIPRYNELVAFAFERAGWDPERFLTLRFSMAFPPIPTTMIMRSVLPASKG